MGHREMESRETKGEARAEVIPGYDALDGQLWQIYGSLRERLDGEHQEARLRERLSLVQQELVLHPPARPRFRLGWPRYAFILVALCMLLAGGAAVAVTNLTNLGGPTSTLPAAPAPPTGNFHRIDVDLRQHGKPELLFLGTQVDGNSAAEAWPVVKALQQFGTLSNVASLVTQPCSLATGTLSCTVPHAPPGYHFQTGYATFDLDHARYRSRYLVFVYRDLIGRNLRVQQLPPLERSLFNRYARVPGYPKWSDALWHTAVGYGSGGQFDEARRFPLVAVGRYLEAGPTLALQGDLESRELLPFATVQRSLQRGRAVGDTPRTLVPDFNAEANVLTALICHADHLQPRNVCRRPAIKEILRHVK